ncbi:hypothetical protein D9M68_266390 [compost metagenome]
MGLAGRTGVGSGLRICSGAAFGAALRESVGTALARAIVRRRRHPRCHPRPLAERTQADLVAAGDQPDRRFQHIGPHRFRQAAHDARRDLVIDPVLGREVGQYQQPRRGPGPADLAQQLPCCLRILRQAEHDQGDGFAGGAALREFRRVDGNDLADGLDIFQRPAQRHPQQSVGFNQQHLHCTLLSCARTRRRRRGRERHAARPVRRPWFMRRLAWRPPAR